MRDKASIKKLDICWKKWISYDCVNDYVSVYLSTQPYNDVVL